jgi:hypothetical protein
VLNELNALEKFELEAPSLLLLALNLLVGIVLALALQWHFKRYGSTLSNKQEFSRIFIALILTTTLIITIVKSSLALSLGLVGALSIVRFRTPIKEPEELVYLFLAIGIGLGLGAGQTVVTVVSSAIIFGTTAYFCTRQSPYSSDSVYLSIGVDGGMTAIDTIHDIVNNNIMDGNLRRMEISDNATEVSYMISISDFSQISKLTAEIREKDPSARVSFVDQHNLPRV